MMTLPHDLYRPEQVHKLDRVAIEEFGILGEQLMGRAGQAAYNALCEKWPSVKCIAVFCGIGNNGGDGFVVARLAHQGGQKVALFQVGDAVRIGGDALKAREAALAAGVPMEDFTGQALDSFDLIVDGLLGTGIRGKVDGEWRHAIEAINRSAKPLIALDIPSGLDGETGNPLGTSVRADLTITFIGLKTGLFSGAGREYCGELKFDALGVPGQVYGAVIPAASRIDYQRLMTSLPPRQRHGHKGDYGHVLIIGGEEGMGGAARMAGEAATRVGAGLVSVATRASHASLLTLSRPELMCHAVETTGQLHALIQRATVIAIGPGLGRGKWGEAMLSAVLESHLPLVVDADALNLLAADPLWHRNWVLTPHPGEAARLLGCDSNEIQQNRLSALASLEASYGGVIVLKGAGTLVMEEGATPALCSAGNPGMASGGMGDLLTGIIAGLIAQGMANGDAARLGVALHAEAGDRAAEDGERGMVASDLLLHLRKLVNPVPE
jgi:hydroxyethylthiazole kinase-like uncharacterized protein yjeF